MYGKYQVDDMYDKGDIHVQKIKVKRLIFRYVLHYLRDWIVNFHELFSICNAYYSGISVQNYTVETHVIILEQIFD